MLGLLEVLDMDALGMLLFFLGSLAFWIFLIIFIVRKIRKVDTRKSGLISIICIVASFTGLMIGAAAGDEATSKASKTSIGVVNTDPEVTRELPISVETYEQSDENYEVSKEVDTDTKTSSVAEDTKASNDDIKPIIAVEPPEPDLSEAENETVTRSQPEVNSSGGGGSNFDTYDIPSQQETSDTYVLNTNTLKIHHPTCNDVRKISPDNYATTNSSIEELMSKGYTTCGHCFR